jgi:hypothetical protein
LENFNRKLELFEKVEDKKSLALPLEKGYHVFSGRPTVCLVPLSREEMGGGITLDVMK